MIKKFLSYMTSHPNEVPPKTSEPEGSDEAIDDILELIPESRSRVYDIRKVIKCIIDRHSFFELKSRFGKSMVTAFARINGRSVGIIANNPMFKGGAVDARSEERRVGKECRCERETVHYSKC